MSEKEKPERHGKPWTDTERMFAVFACKAGASILSICRELKRPYGDVTSKLYPAAVDRDTRTGAVTVKKVQPKMAESYQIRAKELGKELVVVLGYDPYSAIAGTLEPEKEKLSPEAHAQLKGEHPNGGLLKAGRPFLPKDYLVVKDLNDAIASCFLRTEIESRTGRTFNVSEASIRYGKDAGTDKLRPFYPNLKPHEEPTMNSTPVIETKTFINGCDAANLSDGQIFEAIRQQENKKASLEGIKAKPAKLKAQIEAIDKTIAELVTYVDSRNTEK